MYKKFIIPTTLIQSIDSVEGETIEQKIERITTNKEPISDTTQMIYTERNQGVLPDYDIRTDRFEIAIEAMDRVTKSKLTERQKKYRASMVG